MKLDHDYVWLEIDFALLFLGYVGMFRKYAIKVSVISCEIDIWDMLNL